MAEQLPTNKNIKSELGMESSSFKPVIIADLNVDPPETDEDDTTLVSASLLTRLICATEAIFKYFF